MVNKEYWEDRLRRNFSLAGTGHSGFSLGYNRLMYRLKMEKLNRILCRQGINVKGARVLDVGSGTGFFVEYYLKKGAGLVSGVDLTEVSVELLGRKFPSCRFLRLDISKGRYPGEDKFDIINVFDVLYHIVDAGDFLAAIKNIAFSAQAGSWIFISDSLRPELSAASHVRYRAMDVYREALAGEGIDIVDTISLLNLMGRRIDMFSGLTEPLCLLAYLADSLYCPYNSAIMRLLICRKR